MYFVNKIKNEFKENIAIFIDMDGVVTDYNFGYPLNFSQKRPLYHNINVLKEINNLVNVTLYILTVCKTNEQINEKNIWLDKYMPFIEKENRFILSKEKFNNSSKEIKLNFLNNFQTDKKIILIDDDNIILKYIALKNPHIILFQDSSLID